MMLMIMRSDLLVSIIATRSSGFLSAALLLHFLTIITMIIILIVTAILLYTNMTRLKLLLQELQAPVRYQPLDDGEPHPLHRYHAVLAVLFY
jgi:hypothetical protein